MCALPACFGEGREGGEREREHCFCLHARSPSRFHPRRGALPPLARSLAHPLPFPPFSLSACRSPSLRRPHLPPFLLCTCVSAPGVCGRWRADGRRRDDVEAAITPVRVSERSFSISLFFTNSSESHESDSTTLTRLFLSWHNVWFNRKSL